MKRNRKLNIICISSFLLLVFLFLFPFLNTLSISTRKNPAQRFYSVKSYKNGFCISYTHSVNKGRVHDYYVFDKNTSELIMTKTHFVSYGAGIPEPEETEGADFEVLENGYIINNINRRVPRLLMAVGIIANHTISECNSSNEIIGEPLNELPLKSYFAPQTSIILEIKRVSLIEYERFRQGTSLSRT